MTGDTLPGRLQANVEFEPLLRFFASTWFTILWGTLTQPKRTGLLTQAGVKELLYHLYACSALLIQHHKIWCFGELPWFEFLTDLALLALQSFDIDKKYLAIAAHKH